MTIIKKSPSKRVIGPLLQIPVVLVGFGVLFAISNGWLTILLGLLVFAGVFILSVVINQVDMSSHRCPDCDQTLIAAKGWWWRFPGQKFFMHCKPCNIEWDYGYTGHDE